MQNFKIITGKRQTGKTTELIKSYFEYMNCEIDWFNGKETIKLKCNELIDFIYIDTFNSDEVSFLNTFKSFDKENEHTNLKHKYYKSITTHKKLLEVIYENLSKNDCVFFIDNTNILNLNIPELIEIVRLHPNAECKYGCDIIMTLQG